MELILMSDVTHLDFACSLLRQNIYLLYGLLLSTVFVFKTCHLHFFQVKRTLGQFTPAHWDKDEWHPLLGPWRFIQVLSLCIIFLTVELNTFFLKFCLWIPPRNPVIVYRLILWWLIAIPTIREYNSYLQDRYPLSLSLSLPCAHYVHMNESTTLLKNVYTKMNLHVVVLNEFFNFPEIW
jgi:hypothetical protein